MMKYTQAFEGLSVSRLGMGTMRLPVHENQEGKPIDFEAAREIIRRCIKGGINYFDTAYIYHGGHSETFLAKALAEYPRDSYFLADKFNLQANPDFRAQFAQQLERLNTDYIDFYLLHGIQDSSEEPMLQSGCIEYFREMKAQGKIRHFGFSFHGSPDSLRRLLAAGPWDFVQIQLNYMDWLFEDAKELYEILDQAGIPILVMEPLRGGRLASLNPQTAEKLLAAQPGKSLASWGMRWLMRLPRVAVVLSGMSNPDQARDNIATFSEGKPLSEEESALLMQVCQEYRASVAVACTGCRYCTDDCPMGLDIPRILNIYNAIKLDSEWRASLLYSLPEGKRPDSCIGCGACTGHCPQSFDIPAYMAELAEIMKRVKP